MDSVAYSLDDGAYPPERAHAEDAGADLRTPEGFTLEAGGSHEVHTGVHIEVPAGCAGMLKSKSGLNVHGGIVSEGVIDEGYAGEVVVKLYNHSGEPWTFEPGDKVTQIVFVPVVRPAFEPVDRIGGGARGSAGFGSTGR